ncbi:MAG: hypothetical protein HY014_12470 [Acidobacteria bacterium]|nr:hypothetical protein [Acidobacteriota bacterium]
MGSLLKKNIYGALAQLLSFIGLLVNNLIIPKLLGFEVFGRVSAMLSLPYFAQGLVESALFAYVVQLSRFPNTRGAHLRALFNIIGVYFSFIGVAMAVYALAAGIALEHFILMTAITVMMGLYTLLLSINLGNAHGSAIVRNSLLFSLSLSLLPLLFCSMLGTGARGILWSVFTTYAICAAGLWRDARATIEEILTAKMRIGGTRVRRMAQKVALLCGPRLLFVTFNTLAILVFSLFARSQQVALYKLVLSAGIAVIYSVPLHPSIFQATLWNSQSASKTIFLWLASIWILVGAVVLYALLPMILKYIFKGQVLEMGYLRVIPLLTPLLYLVWLTPNLLIGRVSVRTIFYVSLASVGLFLGVSLLAPFKLASDHGLVLAMVVSLCSYAILMGIKVYMVGRNSGSNYRSARAVS